jgi:hypothetical protein
MHGEDTTKLKFTKGDSTEVDMPAQYEEYAQAVLANISKAK